MQPWGQPPGHSSPPTPDGGSVGPGRAAKAVLKFLTGLYFQSFFASQLLKQRLLSLALLIFWIGSLFVVGDYPGHCRMFSSAPGLYLLAKL